MLRDIRVARDDRRGEYREIAEMFEESRQVAEEYWRPQYAMSAFDVDFYNGLQWLDGEDIIRQSEGRPAFDINIIPPYVQTVLGEVFSQTMGVTIASPPAGKDSEMFRTGSGDLINKNTVQQGLINQIHYDCNADSHFKRAMMHTLTGGFAYLRVTSDYVSPTSNLTSIAVECVDDAFSVWPDPSFKDSHGADMNYCFINHTLSQRAFADMFPHATGGGIIGADTMRHWGMMTRPKKFEPVTVTEYFLREMIPAWVVRYATPDLENEHEKLEMSEAEVRVCVRELQDGGNVVLSVRETKTHKVRVFLLTQDGILSEGTWPGTRIPIVFVPGRETRDKEGNRIYKSIFHHAKDSQRMINLWGSAAAEKIAAAPKGKFILTKEQIDGLEEFYMQSSSYTASIALPYNAVTDTHNNMLPPPQFVDMTTIAAGELKNLEVFTEFAKQAMGIFEVKTGNVDNQRSGRAMELQMRQGDINSMEYMSNMQRAVASAAQIELEVVPFFYGDRRALNIMDVEQSEMLVHLERAGQYDMLGLDLGANSAQIRVKAGPGFLTIYERFGEMIMELIKQGGPESKAMLLEYFRAEDSPVMQRFVRRLLPYIEKSSLMPEEKRHLEREGVDLGPSAAEQLKLGEMQAETEKMKVQLVTAQVELEKTRIELAQLKGAGGLGKEALRQVQEIVRDTVAAGKASE